MAFRALFQFLWATTKRDILTAHFVEDCETVIFSFLCFFSHNFGVSVGRCHTRFCYQIRFHLGHAEHNDYLNIKVHTCNHCIFREKTLRWKLGFRSACAMHALLCMNWYITGQKMTLTLSCIFGHKETILRESKVLPPEYWQRGVWEKLA